MADWVKAFDGIKVAGLSQTRDFERKYNRLGVLEELTPGKTHYFLELELKGETFKAEVSKEIWDKYVLPLVKEGT